MASLTSWPTNGRASTLVSFFATEAAPSRSPGTRTPRPASSPSVATRTSATRSLRPGMPSQRAARARRPLPSADSSFVTSAAVVGSATSRRSKVGAAGSAARTCPRSPRRRSPPRRPWPTGRRCRATGSPSAPASSSSSSRLHTVFISKRSKVASAVARSQPPRVSWSTSTSSGTSRTSGMMRALERASSSFSARFSRSLGVCSSRWEKIPSRSPYLVSSLAAVFSPTPGMPGRLSEGSPRSDASNTYCVGRHAGAVEDAGLVVERVVADAALVVEHAHVRVLHELEAVAVPGDDDHLGLALPPPRWPAWR